MELAERLDEDDKLMYLASFLSRAMFYNIRYEFNLNVYFIFVLDVSFSTTYYKYYMTGLDQMISVRLLCVII